MIDIADAGFTGTMPDLVPPPKPVVKPVDIASLPEIKLRTGAYENLPAWSSTGPGMFPIKYIPVPEK